MTGDPFTALIVAVVLAFWVATGIIAILACVASAVLRRRRADALEAIIDATREPVPDHFPHAWTEE